LSSQVHVCVLAEEGPYPYYASCSFFSFCHDRG
jgi:hypothetical protein